jgi:hypothetical protein
LIPSLLGPNNNKRPKTTQQESVILLPIAARKRKLQNADDVPIKRTCTASSSLCSPVRKRKHSNIMLSGPHEERSTQVPIGTGSTGTGDEDTRKTIVHSIAGQDILTSDVSKDYNDYNWWKKALPSLKDEMDD